MIFAAALVEYGCSSLNVATLKVHIECEYGRGRVLQVQKVWPLSVGNGRYGSLLFSWWVMTQLALQKASVGADDQCRLGEYAVRAGGECLWAGNQLYRMDKPALVGGVVSASRARVEKHPRVLRAFGNKAGHGYLGHLGKKGRRGVTAMTV